MCSPSYLNNSLLSFKYNFQQYKTVFFSIALNSVRANFALLKKKHNAFNLFSFVCHLHSCKKSTFTGNLRRIQITTIFVNNLISSLPNGKALNNDNHTGFSRLVAALSFIKPVNRWHVCKNFEINVFQRVVKRLTP